jgi:hypothetical protein
VAEPVHRPADEVPAAAPRRLQVAAVVRWEVLLLAALGCTIAYGAQVSPYFLQSSNLFYICLNVGEVAIMALPLTLLVVTGEIDLSVASTLGLTGVLMAELFKHGWSIWVAMIAPSARSTASSSRASGCRRSPSRSGRSRSTGESPRGSCRPTRSAASRPASRASA